MKKFYSVVLLAILCCVASNVTAQQVPNPSFEDWNGEKFDGEIQPKDWYGSNISQAGINFNLTNREEGHTGSYSIMVKDTKVGALGITELSPGYFSLGRPWSWIKGLDTNTATAGTSGGITWAHRPDTMSVWIKRVGPNVDKEDFYLLYYAWTGTAKGDKYKAKDGSCSSVSQTNEESDIRIALDANECGTIQKGNQIAEGLWREMKQYGDWTNIRVPIYYFNDDVPEMMNIIFSASNYPNFRAKDGLYENSALYVDDVEMIYSSKIDKLYIREREWKAFDPNSAEEQVYSVGKATEIPAVFGVRGVGSITNARGNTATFPGRKLTSEEFKIVQQGAIDGDPMIIQVHAADGSSTTTYKIKFVSAASNNARLADIQVNGTTINGFNAYLNTYNVALPYGTTEVPVVSATAQDAGATVTITQATSTTGTATIHVAAADGTTTNTYTLNFSVAELSDNTLEAIYMDGELVPGFTPTKNNYTISLPLGTTEAPIITWQSAYADGAQTIALIKNSLEEGAQITVSAPAATNIRTYKLTYKIEASSYAYLAGISLDGMPIDGFTPEQTNYSITLPIGTTTLPAITWTQGDPYQTVAITEGGVDGTTRIVVTAAAGNTVTYRLNFSTEKSTNNALQGIALDGKPLEGFHPDTLNYTLTLPAGTTTLPAVTYTPGDDYQTVSVSTSAATNTVRIVVKAGNGASRVYTLTFVIEKSANALLKMIYLDGDSLENFVPDQLTYVVALEQEIIPNVTVDQSPDQKVNITQPASFGTAHIVVQPEVGTPVEYTIIFMSAAEPTIPEFDANAFPLSSNTSLAAIYINGELFVENPSAETYTYELPWRTAQVPSVVPVAGTLGQTITVTSPGLNQTTTIHVVAEDGSSSADYAIVFPVQKSSNTQLELIEVEGVSFDFDPAVREYNIALPNGTTTLPAITFTKAEVEQRVELNTNGIAQPATLKVTAEDGTEATYTLHFHITYSAEPNTLQSIIVDNIGALDLTTGTDHIINLPYGTTDIHFTIVKQYPEQEVVILNGGVSTPTTITVKADDPAKAATVYTITPSVAQYDPATLLDLQVNGETLPQFQPDVYNYVVSVADSVKITCTAQTGVDILDTVSDNTKEMVLLVENDGYAHTYTITYYYPADLTFDLGFETWLEHTNANTGETGTYPQGWYAPINAITSGDKGTYYPNENASASSDKTEGERGAKLSTTYLLTSAEAMPGFLSLSEPTVSVGYWGLGAINQASTLSFGAPRAFRNTPDQVQLDYKYQEHKNKADGWRFIFKANEQKQVDYAQAFSELDKNWHTLIQDITYAADHVPATLDILISAAPSDEPNYYYTNFGTNRSSSTMYFDNLRLNYSSALSAVYVNDVAATIAGTEITATIHADYYGEPSLVFAHAVKDQMPVVVWSEENNGVRTATITNYAEDLSATTYTLTVVRPVSSNTTCTYALEGENLTIVKGSPYQTVTVEREDTRYAITVTAEDGTVATYYADITLPEPTHEVSEAETIEYTPSSATLNDAVLENGILVYEATSPLDTVIIQVTDTAYHLNVFGEAGSNHYTVDRQASHNALLEAIYLDGAQLEEFYESTFTYNLTVQKLPTALTATAIESNALVQITDWIRQDDTHYAVFIQVTAPDGYTKQGYTVAFTIRTLRSTALLSDIRANDKSIDGFSPTQSEYHIELQADESMPTFKAITKDGATATATTAQEGRYTTITYEVISEDGKHDNAYYVVVERTASAICTLDAIYLDGMPLEGFMPNVFAYDVELPYGTTQLPEVTATTSDPTATLSINVDDVRMQATITVTAENKDHKSYVIYFTVAKNSDATLLNIFIDGEPLEGFDTDIDTYHVTLPAGTTQLPEITATTSDPAATYQVQVDKDCKQATITVTAEDKTQKKYIINFTIAKNTDATLLNIFIDGTPLEGFDPTDYEYTIILPYGAPLPEVTWKVADEQQTVQLSWEANTARLTVIAGDQTTTSEYIIVFTNELSDNNYLLSITLRGEPLATFHRDTLAYALTYPVGTAPSELIMAAEVVATPEDPTATVAVQEQGTTLVIIVTAANGNIRAYSIEQLIELSNEARLSMIYLDSVAIEGFDPDTLEYTVKLPQGAILPVVTATPMDSLYATVELGMEQTLEDGSKLIEIDGIAQDGTILTYAVYFTFADWSPTADAVPGDCLFFPVKGTHNTFRAVTISLGVKCAIYTLSGQLITMMDVPVLDVNSVEVETNANGEQVIVEVETNDALGVDYVAKSREPFIYIFYNSNTKRIGRGDKYMTR